MRKIIALLLIALMLLSSNMAFAADDDIFRPQRSDFEIVKDTQTEIIYLYSENGVKYKYVETLNPNEITTVIFKFNYESSQYDFHESFVTNINLLTKKFSGQNNSVNYNTTINSYIDPSTLSYVYYFTASGDNIVAAKSLAITRVLFMAAFPNIASAVAYQIAAEIFELKLEKVWYNSVVHIESGVDPDGPGAKWHKETQVFYSDSRRRSIDMLGSDTFYYQWGW